MSQLLQGKIGLFSDSLLAPEHYWNGFGFTAAGALAIDTVGAIDHYHQGLPFTVAGRLCVEDAPVVRVGNGAAPFTASGKLALGSGGIDSYLAAVPYAGGAVVFGGGGTVNLYPNPTLVGGSDIVADVFATIPTNHVATAFGGVPCDATYLGAGNPAYTFVGTGNSRFAISCNVNTATNRGVTLPGGRKYRFSATVISIGEAAVATRLINGSAAAAGAVIIDGPLIVPDGTPQFTYIDFGLETGSSNIQLRHGMGMFNLVATVGATQQTIDLTLKDIGPYTP